MERNSNKLEWKKPTIVIVDLKDYEKMITANARSGCFGGCSTGCSFCVGCSGSCGCVNIYTNRSI